MNLAETFSHDVQTHTFDNDAGGICYRVLVAQRVVWERNAKPGIHARHRIRLAQMQMEEALHLVALAERAAKDRSSILIHKGNS